MLYPHVFGRSHIGYKKKSNSTVTRQVESFPLRILMTHLFIARFKMMNTCFEKCDFSLLLCLIKCKNLKSRATFKTANLNS